MRLCNITEKGRMVAQSGIVTAMCNRYSVDITPVMHVISQGCNIHAHDIPVGTVILHPVLLSLSELRPQPDPLA